jgi:hypothetical protein
LLTIPIKLKSFLYIVLTFGGISAKNVLGGARPEHFFAICGANSEIGV